MRTGVSTSIPNITSATPNLETQPALMSAPLLLQCSQEKNEPSNSKSDKILCSTAMPWLGVQLQAGTPYHHTHSGSLSAGGGGGGAAPSVLY